MTATTVKIKTKIKENSFYILFTLGILIGACPILAYGVSAFIPFWKALALISTTIVPTIVYLKVKTDNEDTAESYLRKELNSIEGELGDAWKENEKLSLLVEDYEKLCDSQLWEIPCVCGENTFVGLFSPIQENICDCEKCKGKYRITLNYESVLIAEPLNNDQLFESLKTRLESDPSSLKETP